MISQKECDNYQREEERLGSYRVGELWKIYSLVLVAET